MAGGWCTWRALLLLALVVTCCSGQLPGNESPLSALQGLANFSNFRRLLNESGVAQEIQSRSSLTLLVPDNSVLDAVLNRSSNSFPMALVADVLRYHCLLQYLDIPEIQAMTSNNTGILVTSLYQTTGRAAGQNGFVNVSQGQNGAIHLGVPFSDTFNATITRNITQFPYRISYMQIDHVLIPSDLGSPQAAAVSILNMTRALQQAGNFNTFLNLMQTTGLTAVLASLPSFTVFAPTDDAFSRLPRQVLDSLSAVQASQLLSYHVFPVYTSMGTLQSQQSSRAVQTLASNGNSERFLVQVANVKGTINLSTGTNEAQILSPVMDNASVSCYSINRVLLPREIFVTSSGSRSEDAVAPSPAPPLVGAPSLAPAESATTPALAPAAAAPVGGNSGSSPPPSQQVTGASSPAASARPPPSSWSSRSSVVSVVSVFFLGLILLIV